MVWLVIGIVLWSGAHFLPCSGVALRKTLLEKLGEPAYKGIFSLLLLASIAAMVVGWRSTASSLVYTTAPWTILAADGLMLAAFVLLVASAVPTNLKRVVRHPQLAGVAVWGGAHLLANGESRSIVLFGGFGLWALISMALINRRDGAWEKPIAQPVASDLKVGIGAVVVFAVFFFAHVHLFGVSPMPRG